MEIGSVFEINPNCINEAKTMVAKDLHLKEVEKYGLANTVYTASGREAIALALRSMEKENPDMEKRVLLPAYMCDTVFFPFEQNDWELHFYHIDIDMLAFHEELNSLISKVKPSLLFIHGYYGMDTWRDFSDFLKEKQNEGLLIMEDVTQSYYLQTASRADFIIGSLRKWYSIPDGGFVTTNHPLHEEVMTKEQYFGRERAKMLCAKWEYLQKIEREKAAIQSAGRQENQQNNQQQRAEKQENQENNQQQQVEKQENQQYNQQQQAEKIEDVQVEARMDIKQILAEAKLAYLQKNRELEQYLDETKTITSISDISLNLLKDIDEAKHFKRRNENYKLLFEGLKDKACLQMVFQELEKDAAPLYFPVYVEDRDRFQQLLQVSDVFAPVLWPIGKENENLLSEEERYIFDHLLALPMDHRYGSDEMKKIVDLAEKYEGMLI